mmetsp:Transcript_314/g.446  ORF Transcript_314/g.446 Transcript_314/m.446 type:complete len:101 (-) Transcript_314:160-462(-)
MVRVPCCSMLQDEVLLAFFDDSIKSTGSLLQRSTGSLLQKRQHTESKREQLRQAFHAFSSPATIRRTRSARSLSPSRSSSHSRSNTQSALPIHMMQTPVL